MKHFLFWVFRTVLCLLSCLLRGLWRMGFGREDSRLSLTVRELSASGILGGGNGAANTGRTEPMGLFDSGKPGKNFLAHLRLKKFEGRFVSPR